MAAAGLGECGGGAGRGLRGGRREGGRLRADAPSGIGLLRASGAAAAAALARGPDARGAASRCQCSKWRGRAGVLSLLC